MAATTYSSFFERLCEEDRARYVEKLRKLGVCDPYMLPQGAMTPIGSCAALPDISFADIFLYLINFPSCYTGESMKAYKSLDAYKFFAAGKVHDVLVWTKSASDRRNSDGNLYIVRSRVS